jgi:hypothetical protein
MPKKVVVIMCEGRKNAVTSAHPAKLIFFLRQTFDRDKKPASLGHPLWDGVGQHFADGQIHGKTVANPAVKTNPPGRAGSPLPAEGIWWYVRSEMIARRWAEDCPPCLNQPAAPQGCSAAPGQSKRSLWCSCK